MPNDNEAVSSSPTVHESAYDDYAEIHDLAALPLLSIGGDGAIRIANLAAAELLQRERSSLVDRQLTSFVHEADRSRLREHLASQGHAAGRPCEARLSLPGGHVVPVQVYARASWRRPGVAHVSLVDLRERELDAWEKQQLLQAAVRARAANQAKERLIGLLSNELRSKIPPLRAAIAALRGTLPGSGRELRSTLEQIESSLTTEARLLDELLDVAASARPQGTRLVVELNTVLPVAETELSPGEPLRPGDSGVMPRYQSPRDDKLGVR